MRPGESRATHILELALHLPPEATRLDFEVEAEELWCVVVGVFGLVGLVGFGVGALELDCGLGGRLSCLAVLGLSLDALGLDTLGTVG